MLLKDSSKSGYMIKENEEALKTKESNLFGKKCEVNLKKKAKLRLELRDLFQIHQLNPKEFPFKGVANSVAVLGECFNASSRSFHNNQLLQESKPGTSYSEYNEGIQI